MENLDIIKVITEAGSVGVSLVLMFLVWRIVKLFKNSIDNHMRHEEMAYEKTLEIITKNSEVIGSVLEVIKKCPNNIKIK